MRTAPGTAIDTPGTEGLLATVYDCAGLRIRSPLALAAPSVAGPADVEVVAGEGRAIPYERPSTDVIAERTVDGVPRYTFARCGDSVVGRIYHLVDFVFDASHRRVEYHKAPSAAPELVAILIAGTVTAYLLAEQGRLVLHASAVEVSGEALAFVGFSGQGKTTLATLLCAEGHPLVTDDLLPVDTGGDGITCIPAATELRVRDKSNPLVERFGPNVARRRTVDERHAVAAPVTTVNRLRLAAVVIPVPDRGSTEVRARRLPAGEAVVRLTAYQRIEGWTAAATLLAQFQQIAALVESVPVLEMRVPWGPPFPVGLAHEIAAASGLL